MRITDILAAFAAATLAGTGIGGGGLFVIYLTSMGLYSQSDAQALNLVFFISASAASLLYHRRHRIIRLRMTLPCTFLGGAGTLIGGALRHTLPEAELRMLFGSMLILCGGMSVLQKLRNKGKQDKK